MKATELREMSDEQLELTLKETERQPVPPADAGADRAARRAERAAAAPPADRPDQDHSDRASQQGRGEVSSQNRQHQDQRTSRSHAQASSHRRRHERQDGQDPARRDSAAGAARASTARSCAAARCATCTTRRTSRSIGDTVEIVECPPAVASSSGGSWCGSSTKSQRGRTSPRCGAAGRRWRKQSSEVASCQLTRAISEPSQRA